jgi:aromatic-L-amino-acid decarboxylase
VKRRTLRLKKVRHLSDPPHATLLTVFCLEVISYNASLPTLPVLPTIQPGYLAPLLPSSAPTTPESWPAIQSDIASKIVPGLTHWQSPNFMAFFPAGVTYPSLLGEMYSAAFTAPAFNWLCSPACTELETIVTDWMAKAMALPECFLSKSANGGGGVIQGSASEAVVTVMVAARERYLREKCDKEGLKEGSKERDDRVAELRGRLVALSSDQAHSSTQKGALIAGTRYKSIAAEYDEELALTGEKLRRVLEECEKDGLEPYFLTTSLGTTGTCAVDRFSEVGEVKIDYPAMWVHVDAAYAGAALVCEEYQHYSRTFTMADSFDMNMHKWLLVNFDASCLYVQNRNHLTRALSITPSYLQNNYTDSGLVTDYRDWQIPLGRRFRALKIWFVMRSYGLDGMKAHIRKTIKIGEVFRDLVEERSDLFEIVAPPRFALTCFRVKPSVVAGHSAMNGSAGMPSKVKDEALMGDFIPNPDAQAETDANAVTKEISELINHRGEIFITSSTSAGKSMIRVVSGNPNAEEKYVRNAFDIIVRTTDEVLQKRQAAVPNGKAT